MRLSAAHVVVTGASRGIGAALARGAAERGATVTLVARNAGRLREFAVELDGHALPADLADRAQLRGLIDRAEQQAGQPVDVLINNAGIDAAGSMLDLDADALADAIMVNLLAPAELSRQALPGMVARGRGHVVNLSSGFSTVNAPGLTPYCATKAGLSHFTGGLAVELAGTGVGTTLVEPGPVRTGMYEELAQGLAHEALRRMIRLQLTAEVDPTDVAEATLDKVESGGGHVVLPRRMAPGLAFTWLPRAVSKAALVGVRRR